MQMVPVESWLPTCRRMGAVLVFTGVKGLHDYPKSDWTIAWARAASTQRNGALRGFNNWEPILVYGLESLDNDLFSIPNFPDDEAQGHPTPKPLRLMEHVVDRTSKWGTTILDPFCGSGTTLVAAKKLGRHFLGFEISHDYCEIARNRLAEIDAQPSLFEPKAEQLTL
jgi:DNA modification methylase